MSKPVFSSIIDLGLRDVGVANRPRRFAAHLGRGFVPLVAAAVLYAVIACLLIRSVGVPALLVVLAWPAIMLGPGLRTMIRAPVLVLKVTAEGRNQATWMIIAPYLLLVPLLLLAWNPLSLPVALVAAVMVAVLWRVRGRVPAMVRTLRSALEAGEPVRGDGVGIAKGVRPRHEAVRVLAATDRRLLATGRAGVLLDVPYEEIRRFGIGWTLRGRVGTLTLDVGGDGHAIASIAPPNLLSLAEALRVRGVPTEDGAAIDEAGRGWEEALARGRRPGSRRARIAAAVLAAAAGLLVTATAAGYDLMTVPVAVQQLTGDRLPVDGRSNLTGGAASLSYTPVPGLHELRTDEHWGEAPDDGARWELRSSFTRGQNVVSLSHYVFVPRLDDPAAVAAFVAGKDLEQSRIAGFAVQHRERVVGGRTGYVWTYRSRRGYWQHAAWFPHPEHSVRVECIAKKDAARFRRLCAEAMASLRFRR